MPTLSVESLGMEYMVEGRGFSAVNDVNFQLGEGESMALVGESGSGKSTIGLGIMGLLPPNGRISSGKILFGGKDIASLPQRELRAMRWKRISMVFQGSMNALDPILTVERQLSELLKFHENKSRKESRPIIVDMLRKVGLEESVADLYPHEMSGGMKQRVVIAMALLLRPDLLIADEPTTALDVTTQAEIIIRLKKLIKEEGMSVIFITHDLSLAPQLCRRVVILYGGTTMETGLIDEIFARPLNPYTSALMGSVVSLDHRKAIAIPGDPPTLQTVPSGCPFNARCPRVFDRCHEEFPREIPFEGRSVRCHLYAEGRA